MKYPKHSGSEANHMVMPGIVGLAYSVANGERDIHSAEKILDELLVRGEKYHGLDKMAMKQLFHYDIHDFRQRKSNDPRS